MEFDLDLWTKHMYSLHKRVGIDNRGETVYRRAIVFMRDLSLKLMDSNLTASEGDFEGDVVAMGSHTNGNDTVLVRVKVFDDAHKDRSELDITVYSDNPATLLPLLEKIKHVL